MILEITLVLSYNSMTPNSPTIAIGVHASASVALLFFLFEQWECDIYWWILAICRLVHIYLIVCVYFSKSVFPWQILHPALAVHCSASVSLSFFVFEKWECWTYWVIFAICRLVCLCVYVLDTVALFLMVLLRFLSMSFSPSSVLPAFVEILLFIAVFGLKKKPLWKTVQIWNANEMFFEWNGCRISTCFFNMSRVVSFDRMLLLSLTL